MSKEWNEALRAAERAITFDIGMKGGGGTFDTSDDDIASVKKIIAGLIREPNPNAMEMIVRPVSIAMRHGNDTHVDVTFAENNDHRFEITIPRHHPLSMKCHEGIAVRVTLEPVR